MSKQPERASAIRCEVAYALPEEQVILTVRLEGHATVADAIRESRIEERFSDLQANDDDVGVWSRPCAMNTRLSDGDRVEIYRPLVVDPKDARRERAKLTARAVKP